MNPLIQLKKSAPLFVIALLLTWFALSPRAQAVVPPPDGGYPGGNTAEGDGALQNLTIGVVNTAVGSNALFFNTNGNSNTAVGADALLFNISGSLNTAIGTQALINNIDGRHNTATGVNALFSNDTGRNNTAIGFQTLVENNSGSNNTATGFQAMFNNLGSNNTATGFEAMFNNLGFHNTATGFQALFNNNVGNGNTANGANALLMNNDGSQDTATGINALRSNTIGNNNVAEGAFALLSSTIGNNNVAEGAFALSRNTSGSSNIALGFNAGSNLTTGSNNIDIGASGVVGESNTIRIGRPAIQNSTFIAGIFGVAMSGSVVVVNSSGKLGVTPSSARFKDNIKAMGKASEMILQLKPVTFRYKEQIDPDRIPQFGLIAEEVEKVNPDLIVRDADGKINTVRYEAVNAMLLNEFLKEHKKVEELEGIVTSLAATVKEQAAQIQKVSAQLGASKRASQVVNNNQ
jgi:Chaperone of endosialidase